MALTIPTNDCFEAWSSVKQMIRACKQQAVSVKAASEAGPISSESVLRLSTICADTDAQIVIGAAVPGIVAYVRDQLDNPTLDVAAEFSAVRTALTDLIGWVVANFPAQAGYLQAIQIQASGRYTWRTLTTVQTAGLRTEIDALVAALP